MKSSHREVVETIKRAFPRSEPIIHKGSVWFDVFGAFFRLKLPQGGVDTKKLEWAIDRIRSVVARVKRSR